MKVGEYWMEAAATIARNLSTCKRGRCGAVIVRDREVLGAGFNGPAWNQPERCGRVKASQLKPMYDRTCCVHAEWRALLEASKSYDLHGSTLFFTRVDAGGQRLSSGMPACTVSSRLALELGVSAWVLDHTQLGRGLVEYPAATFDELAYQFDELVAHQAAARAAKVWTELPSPLWLREDWKGDRGPGEGVRLEPEPDRFYGEGGPGDRGAP